MKQKSSFFLPEVLATLLLYQKPWLYNVHIGLVSAKAFWYASLILTTWWGLNLIERKSSRIAESRFQYLRVCSFIVQSQWNPKSYSGTFAYVVNPKIRVERNMILTHYLIAAKCFKGLKQFFGQLFIINLCFRINKNILIIQRNSPQFTLSKFIWPAGILAFFGPFLDD